MNAAETPSRLPGTVEIRMRLVVRTARASMTPRKMLSAVTCHTQAWSLWGCGEVIPAASTTGGTSVLFSAVLAVIRSPQPPHPRRPGTQGERTGAAGRTVPPPLLDRGGGRGLLPTLFSGIGGLGVPGCRRGPRRAVRARLRGRFEFRGVFFGGRGLL